ncbi:carboxymuconolactone decarboxylase family protein [Bacillus safensis]|uniref:carboxymuconolactone decarboxylase family protein n=1 Tax=Bacillus safensis TaxID=561879 RepID=UPI0022370CB5|nr:carboxymuconolactone decarboxylase family protein [Bacillus safensis]MCW4645563.1 carboxymuconolactone decarboxylase family protein [Bacillus safensis]MCY7565050.1 carboxymuconolactone decarboxylase family protein [Bacillus safensis]MCY7624457.1 carboxymuconolactone decarboxylase family protein [Bacillus safensis]MCY7632229.1 carboxymuconolactone decarboxylase family protein [Bacillus safensis]MCY7647099.1 carboxymuconolactone decarboxylase family protein [Bacillus safensis]
MNEEKETCQVKQEKAAGNREKLSIYENESIRSNIEQLTIELSEQKEFSHFILDEKQKAISTLSSLITKGDCDEDLKIHFEQALHIGLSVIEIMEIIKHCTKVAGFPHSINALTIFQNLLDENK